MSLPVEGVSAYTPHRSHSYKGDPRVEGGGHAPPDGCCIHPAPAPSPFTPQPGALLCSGTGQELGAGPAREPWVFARTLWLAGRAHLCSGPGSHARPPPSPHNPIAPSRGPGPHVPPHNPADPLQTRRVREGCSTTFSHLGSPREPQGAGRALLWSAVLPQPSHLSDSAWKPPTWFLPADPGAFSPWCRVLDLPDDEPVLGVGTCPVFDK